MHWPHVPYVVTLITTTMAMAGLALFVWRRRCVPARATFALLMLAAAVWLLGYALELGSDDVSGKVLWAKLQYLSIVAVPSAWLAFVLQYTGRAELLSRRNVALLAAEPLATLVLVWTNQAHGMIWRNTTLRAVRGLLLLEFDHGLWFWVHIAYSYTLLLVSTLLLSGMFTRVQRPYRDQIGVLLIAALAPWVGNALYILDLTPLSPLDLTPFAFALSSVVVAWGLCRSHLLDVMPVARDAIIQGMVAGVIVLDAQDRIVNMNEAAGQMVGCRGAEVIGQPADRALASWPDLAKSLRGVTHGLTESALGAGETQRHCQVRVSSLHDRRGLLSGRVIVLSDVTDLKRTEEALRQTTRDLGERVKELNSLYDIHRLVDKPGASLEEILQAAADLIPTAWQYAEVACARVLLEDREFATENWRETTWKLASDIVVRGKWVGTVEVCYLEERAESDEGPFLKEERRLVDAIAEQLGQLIELKRAEDALRETHDYLQSLFSHANAPIVVWDPEFRITRFNHAFERLTDHAADEVVGQGLSMLFPEASRDASLRKIRHTLTGEPWESVEIPILRKDGGVRLVLWNSANIHDEGGRTLLATIAQGQDITELKRAEEAQQEREQRFRALFEYNRDTLIVTDASGHCLDANAAALSLTGYGRDELIGMSLSELTVAQRRGEIGEMMRRVLADGGEVIETTILGQDGRSLPVEIVMSSLSHQGEQMFLSSMRDITERRRLERLQAEFVSTVSHELRTPLASILGFGETLLGGKPGPLTQTQREFLEISHESGKLLLRLIDDLLDVGRLEAGRLVLQAEEVDLPELLRDVIQAMVPTAEQKGVWILQEVPGGAPILVEADRRRLEQIASNLMSNAVKFTPAGGCVAVALERTAPGEVLDGNELPREGVHIRVQDSGIGVPPEDLPHLFERFHRGTNVMGQVIQGTGLGLHITRGLVQAHHGHIWAESQVGAGSTFHVWLPVRQPLPSELEQPELVSRIAKKYFED